MVLDPARADRDSGDGDSGGCAGRWCSIRPVRPLPEKLGRPRQTV
jgi:hypothetical protein